MFKRKHWDIEQFNNINLPEIIGTINPTPFSNFNHIRVLDMPLHMPKQGWKIPDYINLQFKELLDLVINHEAKYGDLSEHYVYITIDQKVVKEGKTGRRPGAHSDAYVEHDNRQVDITSENAQLIEKETGEVSHTYICTDIFPTEFFLAKFPLKSADCKDALETFDQIASRSPVVTYQPYMILKLDPYVVHRAAIATHTTERTFVKISISKKKYAREGNTINPGFSYDWKMEARSPHERNHPWS